MPMTQEELARRLRAAREACGLTQEDVSRHLSVSRPTVAQMELGNRGVTSLELDKLAYLYGRDIREFFAEEFRADDALLVLFRGHADVAGQEPVLDALRECLALGREITNLERLVGVDRGGATLPDYGLPAPRTRWEAIQHGQRVAASERRRLDLGNAPLPNVADLLETHGVRTAQVRLAGEVSGLTLVAPDIGAFVAGNLGHGFARQRFSYAHEYCHVLLDRAQKAAISRADDRDNVLEVRANAFAASFLMPAEGVQEFVEGLAKGRPSRLRAEVFDEGEALQAEGRPEPGSQAIQMYDVVLLAHHFKVSRISALYRLKNLKLLNQPEFDALREQEEGGVGRAIAELLDLKEPDHEGASHEFRSRFLALGFEALRRGQITRRKLAELAGMVGIANEALNAVLRETGLDELEEAADALVPH